jgi:hypothetical protein
VDDRSIAERLDRIAAILQMAFREPLAAARAEIRRDPVNQALLERAADDWVASGELKKHIVQATGQSEATVKRRIAILIAEGALAADGTGTSIRYRSTGLL